jgi:hypothetical protein
LSAPDCQLHLESRRAVDYALLLTRKLLEIIESMLQSNWPNLQTHRI